jgi:indole-3-glycerol phosphate synthase
VSVLDSIIAGVREDLAKRRKTLNEINEEMATAAPALDAHAAFKTGTMSVIAEVKRSSPSKGALSTISDPAALAERYESAGASVISVLTEERRFKGTLADLTAVRSRVSIPILRKDFMVDEYQFFEARANGADMVLLIVAALAKSQLRDFFDLATELGMASLIEVHTAEELERAMEISPRIIGVNSRNLKTLDVDSAAFSDLIPRIPAGVIRVAESGISKRSDVEFAQRHGADAILVGEALVTSDDPNLAMRTLLGQG